MRFHSESFLSSSDIAYPAGLFLEWVKTLIPKDKYNIFVSLFQFPISTPGFVDSIYTELERVFDGKNPYADYQFTDTMFKDDWNYFRQEKLGGNKAWRQAAWKAVKTAINSIVVVDLPSVQTDEYAEPYYYFLNIERVMDYSLKGLDFEYLIFKLPNSQIACFDDAYYRVLQLDKAKNIGSVIVEREHQLGYCPARFFWSDAISGCQTGLKRSPISPQLADLDWLLFFSISKRHLDLYAPYPIYSAYQRDCDFKNNETGEYCDGGFLRNPDATYKQGPVNTLVPCPVCALKTLTGAGSFVEVPAPLSKDEPDMRNPVQITTIDSDALDYNVSEIERLKNNIFVNVVGKGGDIQQKQSINELQVEANFESKISVLRSLKQNLEAAQKFVYDTCCRLRYGDNFISSSVSMGTEFYMSSVSDLYAQYKNARETGSSEAVLDSILTQIIETEHKDNPSELQRALILKNLEPYKHFTLSELLSLYDKQLLDANMLKIKINFSSLIDRFERENVNILEFASQVEFYKKIDIIRNKLLDYINEKI